MNGPVVLVAEDDEALRAGLVDNLRVEGYQVLAAADGEAALELAFETPPDLLLLDVMLPKVNGFDVCRRIRERDPEVPIMMLTAKTAEQDVVLGLNLGADDYVTKPFRLRELLARIKAHLRRRSSSGESRREFGGLVLDLGSRRLWRGDVEVELTPKEFALLAYLSANPARAVSREQILQAVWGTGILVTNRSVDRCVTTLRKKIEVDSRHPKLVVTLRDLGYRFDG